MAKEAVHATIGAGAGAGDPIGILMYAVILDARRPFMLVIIGQ
jgi:hypothetical protein